jgi:hypothetical protein
VRDDHGQVERREDRLVACRDAPMDGRKQSTGTIGRLNSITFGPAVGDSRVSHRWADRRTPAHRIGSSARRIDAFDRTMSFSTILHGDIAQCVAHCLTLSDLAHWSRVDRGGRVIIASKLSDFKSLDIGRYPNMNLTNFARLCARLRARGVEVLLLPFDHLCLVHSFPFKLERDDNYDESEDDVEAAANLQRIREFFSLVDANLHCLQAIGHGSESRMPQDRMMRATISYVHTSKIRYSNVFIVCHD